MLVYTAWTDDLHYPELFRMSTNLAFSVDDSFGQHQFADISKLTLLDQIDAFTFSRLQCYWLTFFIFSQGLQKTHSKLPVSDTQ